jgi:hypothetical protein
MARPLFTDGWNSFWHVAFGFIAVWYWPVGILFALYQLYDPFEQNIVIDFSEFFVGYGLGYLVKYRKRLL